MSYTTSADRAHESTHCIRTGVGAVPRLSRAALILGPNAGGKTNILLGLSMLRDLVLYSTSWTEAQFADRYTPFQFGAQASHPTELSVDVLIQGIRYRYAVGYDARRITFERLLVYRTGKAQRWFERHVDPGTGAEEWMSFSPSFTGPREMWRRATRSKALFLSTAAQLNSEHLRPLFHWFEHCVEMVFSRDIAELANLAAHVEDASLKSRMLSLLRSADIPVDDFRVVARGESPDSGSRVEFLHSRKGKFPIWLSAAHESAGTNRLLGLLGPLLRTIDHGKLMVIDEFDTSLHPLVARLLIQLIHTPTPVGRAAQLILTSHNTTLMDLDILRRDEIWLVQLDESNASRLSPLLRSSPRKHEMVGKAYLRGRYGAVPTIRNEYLYDASAGDAVPRGHS